MTKYKSDKNFFFIVFFLTILSVTFYKIFSNNNIKDIVTNISKISLSYISLCLLLMCLYFILQGIYMKRNLALLNKKISINKGIFYSMVEFFFSGVTPSSTGGQPVQIYYMNKDKIGKKTSIITLLINTIYFKLVLVIFGIAILIVKPSYILHISTIFVIFYFIGIAVDLIIITGGYFLLYKPIFLKKILMIVERFIKKIKKNYNMRIDENIGLYKKNVKKINNHKLELFIEFLITLAQRLCLFSISYVIYRAFGLNDLNYIQVVMLQIIVQISIEFIPLPGGTGVSEYLYSVLFILAFGSFLAPASMILTRAFIFYIPLVLCGIIILFKHIKDQIREKNKNLH